MEIIEYRGFKNIFIALIKVKDQYYIIYGHTDLPNIKCETEYIDSLSSHDYINLKFIARKTAEINIPFVCNNNNSLISCMVIQNKKSYEEIAKVLENIL